MDQEDDENTRDHSMDELVAHNAAKGVTYGWGCSTSHGEADEGEPIDLLVDGDEDDIEEDDSQGIIPISDSVEEMVTDDTNDAEDVEATQHNEYVYPPPPREDREIIMRMGKRKEPNT